MRRLATLTALVVWLLAALVAFCALFVVWPIACFVWQGLAPAADGSTTVIEATFRIRPQPAARMAGSTRSVRRKTDSTIDSK